MWRTLLACITTSILTAYCVTHLQAEQALAWLPAANSAAAAAAAFATGGISTPGWPLEGEFSLRRLRALKGNSSSSLEHHDSESLDGGSSSSSSSSRELLYQGGGFSPTWRRQHGAFKSRWHGTVLRSVFKAQSKVRSTKEQRASRIFVPLLSNRHEQLCCMLTDLNAKVGATNALDVWVFSVDHEAETVYNKSPCWRRKFNITVAFMVLDEHWTLDPRHSSSAVHDRNAWVGLPGLFGEDYRRMGHWRLAFQPAFADMLGYKLLWQLDDDSFFTSPLNISMADHMRQHDLWVAGAKTMRDPHMVSWGLAEMARLFLVAERLEPPGTLFTNHTQPPGLEGLYTVRSAPGGPGRAALAGDAGGWSRTVIHGNNLVMDLDKFWWPARCQRFVELVLQSGFHYRFRWNEQGVIAMLWQMFVPEGHFQFDTLPMEYQHPRKVWGNCSSAEQRTR